MKTKAIAPLIIAASLPLGVLFAQELPKPFEIARYQGMLDRSPFAVATAVAAPAATPNFAKDLYVANAARAADGVTLVTIASSADKNFKIYAKSNEPVDGYTITNIEWSEKVGATKVTITKDGQTATLSFNEALLRQPLASGQTAQQQQPPVQPQPNVPAPNSGPQQHAQQQQPNVQKPMPVPSLPTPPPRVRGVIPRNPVPNTTPFPVPQATPNPAEPEL
jgi:hypothetical protein